ALIVVVRLLARHARRRGWATAGTIAGGTLLILLVVGPTYLRNWIVYRNPLWPIIIDVPRFNLHFPGHQRLSDLERPWSQIFHDAYAAHTPGHDFADTLVHSHGLAIPWVVLPIAAIALPIAVLRALRSLLGAPSDARTNNLLLVAIPMLATLPLSPAPWALRYNVH